MFTTATPSTPASWVNTGGDARVHRVPAGTALLEATDRDDDGFLPSNHFQVTTPLCGLGIFHGAWEHRPVRLAPYRPCTTCYPTTTEEN